MTDRPIAGFECKLYYNTANVGQTAQWVEIKNAKDVNLPDSVEAIEASARYSKSKRYIAGLFDGSIEFGYQYIRGTDAVFAALEAGLDLLCIGNNLLAQSGECLEIARALVERVARDAAFAARLDDARERIEARKRFAAGA